MFHNGLSYQPHAECGAGDKWPWESGGGASSRRGRAGGAEEPASAKGEAGGKRELRKRLRWPDTPDSSVEPLRPAEVREAAAGGVSSCRFYAWNRAGGGICVEQQMVCYSAAGSRFRACAHRRSEQTHDGAVWVPKRRVGVCVGCRALLPRKRR